MTESLPQDTQVLSRAPYSAPKVEALGAWSTLTLQQSVPIAPDIDAEGLHSVVTKSL